MSAGTTLAVQMAQALLGTGRSHLEAGEATFHHLQVEGSGQVTDPRQAIEEAMRATRLSRLTPVLLDLSLDDKEKA